MLKINPDSELRIDEQLLSPSGRELFSHFRRVNNELFSDTEIVYENRLTPELFDLTLSKLSQERRQVQFENFVLAVATRMITPNIKPQTGPDGGGDGKVDGETYPVDRAISDKWWVSDGSSGDQRWAVAISVKKNWKQKVDDDVRKIVGTNRGYTRVLFFTNQKIPSRIRFSEEEKMSEKYSVTVSIFDGTWCSFVVFEQNCLDIALEKLAFSQEYRKKNVKVGPNDKKRQEDLDRLEKDILSHVAQDRDTNYVDDLLTTCLLSRGLSRPRQETEGRFQRAMREASTHGSDIQRFNIVYYHALTSFFWFYDVNTTCRDYLTLKEYTIRYPAVKNLEHLASILTIFINTKAYGISCFEGLEDEILFFEELRARPNLSEPSQCFIDLFLCEYRISQLIFQQSDPTEEVKLLLSLIQKSTKFLDIKIEPHATVIDSLSSHITDCPAFEDLVDLIADITSKRGAELQGANVHFARGETLFEHGEYVPAIRHLGPCIKSFYNLGCETQFIVACYYMANALFNQDLLFSAKAYLVHSVSFLVGLYMKSGTINPFLYENLFHLCQIELRLGQLVMYLNWFELMRFVERDIQDLSQFEGISSEMGINELIWARQIASSDISDPVFETLPDILERNELQFSSDSLKYLLGHKDKLSSFTELIDSDWQEIISHLPLPNCFTWPLSISKNGPTTLTTFVNNSYFHVTFENSIKNYLLAETLLACIETVFATFSWNEIVPQKDSIRIQIIESKNDSSFVPGNADIDYVFMVNHETLGASVWQRFIDFLCLYISRNADSSALDATLIIDRLEREQILERTSALIHLNKAVYSILDHDYKFTIDQWKDPEDKVYPLVGDPKIQLQFEPHSSVQQSNIVCFVSSNMKWWDESEWRGIRLFERENSSAPPVLALLFTDLEVGKKIVAEWKRRAIAGSLSLEVQMVKGIDRDHPSWYAVTFAPVIPMQKNEQGCNIAVNCRRHVMTPDNTDDFDRFEQAFSRSGSCLLIALAADEGQPLDLEESFEFSNVLFTDAWKISVYDNARVSIVADSNPVIPKEYEKIAPVLELLGELRGLADMRD